MNVALRCAVAAVIAVGLAACTTTQDRRVASHTPVEAGAWRSDLDSEYVARVERIARRRGVDVHWIHAPRLATRPPPP